MPRFPVPLGDFSYEELDLLDDGTVSLCWACGLAEPIDGVAYRICFECGHVYQTEQALVAAHNEWLIRWGEPLFEEDAEEVWSCPVCAHDF